MGLNPKSFIIMGFLLAAAPGLAADKPDPRNAAAAVDFFEKKVRPILVGHCYTCHSADTKPAGGLRVDDRNGLLHGGKTGPAVVPGDPERSLLLQRVTQAGARSGCRRKASSSPTSRSPT